MDRGLTSPGCVFEQLGVDGGARQLHVPDRAAADEAIPDGHLRGRGRRSCVSEASLFRADWACLVEG